MRGACAFRRIQHSDRLLGGKWQAVEYIETMFFLCRPFCIVNCISLRVSEVRCCGGGVSRSLFSFCLSSVSSFALACTPFRLIL